MHKKNKIAIKKYYSSSEVVTEYDRKRFFGRGGVYINENEVNPIIDLLIKTNNVKVLDLGAGRGRLSRSVKKMGYEVYCLDSSEEMAEVLYMFFSKKNVFVQSVFEKIKTKKKFQVVTSLRFFDHFSIKDQEKILKNIKQSLSKDGIIIFAALNKNSLESTLARLFPYGKVNYFYSNREYRRMFDKLNLKVSAFGGSFILPRGIFLFLDKFPFLLNVFMKIDTFLSKKLKYYNSLIIYRLEAKKQES